MGHNIVVLGHLKSIRNLRVDGLLTGPLDLEHHKMAFRLKIIQVGKFSTSWSLTKLPDIGTHA